MKRTLKLLGLIGVATAAGVAAVRAVFPETEGDAEPRPPTVHGLPSVTQELRQALHQFEERFGA